MTTNRVDRQAMLDQIGRMNVLAISGGRVRATEHGVELPVSNGYRVRVDYNEGADDYTVRRVLVRGAKEFEKGAPRERVYADQVGEIAYRAGMFRSYDAEEW